MNCLEPGCTRRALRDSNYCAEHRPRPRAGGRKKAPAKKPAGKAARKKK
jgi:hypothetical protein